MERSAGVMGRPPGAGLRTTSLRQPQRNTVRGPWVAGPGDVRSRKPSTPAASWRDGKRGTTSTRPGRSPQTTRCFAGPTRARPSPHERTGAAEQRAGAEPCREDAEAGRRDRRRIVTTAARRHRRNWPSPRRAPGSPVSALRTWWCRAPRGGRKGAPALAVNARQTATRPRRSVQEALRVRRQVVGSRGGCTDCGRTSSRGRGGRAPCAAAGGRATAPRGGGGGKAAAPPRRTGATGTPNLRRAAAPAPAPEGIRETAMENKQLHYTDYPHGVGRVRRT